MVWGAQLTPEQQARLPKFVDKWTKIALSTAPVDRERAEWALIRFYHAAGLAEPRVVWLPCPMSAALSAIAYARVRTAGRERAVRGLRHRANFVEAVTDDLFFANHAARRPIRCAVEAALGSALRQAPHRDAGADLAAEFGGAAGAVRRAAFAVVLHPSLHQTMLTGITLPIARAVDGVLRHTRIALEMVGRRVSSPVLRTAAAAWLGGSQSLTHAAQRDYADQVLKVPMDRKLCRDDGKLRALLDPRRGLLCLGAPTIRKARRGGPTPRRGRAFDGLPLRLELVALARARGGAVYGRGAAAHLAGDNRGGEFA